MSIVPNIFKSDKYKYSHFKLYPNDMEFMNSYIETRGVETGRDWKEVVHAGTPYYLETMLSKPLVTEQSLERAAKRIPAQGNSFNYDGFASLLKTHGGMAPVQIQSLPEGMVVPIGTPQFQIVNMDRRYPWVTSWLETTALRSIWYPSTVATLSFHCKRTIARYMDETAGHREGLDFMLHDFGDRGVSSEESAIIGGIAHLYNFQGSDTTEAVEFACELFHDYNFDAAYSVDAAEHSTVTSFGGPSFELEAFEHAIDNVGNKPNTIFSVVSDSYDLWDAIDNKWGGALKDKVIDLGTRNSRLVVRPDSGDPHTVPVICIQKLMDKFGYTLNAKGYAVLPPYVRVLQGDGINEKSIAIILENMKQVGLSAENIVFGMGGELLQKVNRDTLKYAMKASSAKRRDGDWYDVYKDPATDAGKRSKKGRQAVVKRNGIIQAVREADLKDGEQNLLEEVYSNGFWWNKNKLPDIRARINAAL